MKKMAAMTAIVALISMPVLAAEQGGFNGPGATQTSQTSTQKGGFIGPSGSVTTVTDIYDEDGIAHIAISLATISPFDPECQRCCRWSHLSLASAFTNFL